MSDAIREQLQNAYAQVNTALTSVYGKDGERLFLLKTAGNSKKLVSVFEIVNGYKITFNNFREQMQFKVSTTDQTFVDKLASASYIGFGVPNSFNEIDVYSISFEERDRVAPNAKDVQWNLFANRKREIRHTIV